MLLLGIALLCVSGASAVKDCQLRYSEWSECIGPCGPGTRHRSITIVNQPVHGGKPCPTEKFEQTPCNTGRPCSSGGQQPVVDCAVTWSAWTQCDASCGQGLQQRWATVLKEPRNGGRPCPALEETRSCNAGLCNPRVDCVVVWSDWSACDVSCGQGIQQRWASVVTEPRNGGRPCPLLEETRSCSAAAPLCNPPVDCLVLWSDWTSCSVSCGQGREDRWAAVITEPRFGGRPCPANLEETRTCTRGTCDQDCQYQYSDWTNCDAVCDYGQQFRWISVTHQPVGNGRRCPSPLEESRQCFSGVSCNPPVGCVVEWSAWSACDTECGPGKEQRWAVVVTEPKNGGRQCPPLEETRPCSLGPCSKDCEYVYSDWTRCDAECGNGQQFRWISVVKQPIGNGRPCPSTLEETRPCNSGSCGVDCQYQYSDWTACDVPCGVGQQQRWIAITVHPSGSGRPCPSPLEESRQCDSGIQCNGFPRRG